MPPGIHPHPIFTARETPRPRRPGLGFGLPVGPFFTFVDPSILHHATHPIPLRLQGVGSYLPPWIVDSSEVDRRTGVPNGWTLRHTGVAQRRQIDHHTTVQMAASALRSAFATCPWKDPFPDLLLNAGSTPQQPIPCTAALVAQEMGWHGIPCFDVNATCLGFVVALQVAGALLAAGNYRRIAIVCSEIASIGLNWKQPESAGLMGDGAAAVLIEAGAGDSTLFQTLVETWPEGAATTEVRGGGTKLPPFHHQAGENTDEYLFDMQGLAVFRLAAAKMEPFVERLVGSSSSRWDDIDWVIPHQASLPAIRHLRRRLGIPASKVVETIQHHGNVISASMPLALHELILSGRLHRGQTVMFLGTSAGLSLGGALLRY